MAVQCCIGNFNVSRSKKVLLQFGLVGVFVWRSFIAQAASPDEINLQYFNVGVAMSSVKYFDPKQLESPKTPQELLRVLHLISENFLLLDPEFQSDKILQKLFGPGEILGPTPAFGVYDWLQNKKITLKNNSIFNSELKIEDIVFSIADFPKEIPSKKSASMFFSTTTEVNPLAAELIKDFFSDAKWYDPLGGVNALGTQENKTAFIIRPLKTHPNGYFWIDDFHENEKQISKLIITLNKNGSLHDVRFDQKIK